MKGSLRVFSLVVLVLLASTVVSATEEYALTLEKTISPGYTSVKFNGLTYRFYASGNCQLLFETVDDTHAKLFLKPVCATGTNPYYEVSVQWGSFTPVFLSVDSCDGDTWILGAETGYAEK